MSLDKGIEHGKEKRRAYRGSKRFDRTCRNHGACSRCRDGRLHASRRREPLSGTGDPMSNSELKASAARGESIVRSYIESLPADERPVMFSRQCEAVIFDVLAYVSDRAQLLVDEVAKEALDRLRLRGIVS